MDSEQITKKCFKCNGAGIYTQDSPEGSIPFDPCPVCLGMKYLKVYEIRPPLNIFRSYQVFEATDMNEYQALSTPKTKVYQFILSMPFIDLNEGSNSRQILFNLFPEESQTRQNLLNLL